MHMQLVVPAYTSPHHSPLSHTYSALHDHRNKLLADVFYTPSMIDNIHQEGLQLEALELQGYVCVCVCVCVCVYVVSRDAVTENPTTDIALLPCNMYKSRLKCHIRNAGMSTINITCRSNPLTASLLSCI